MSAFISRRERLVEGILIRVVVKVRKDDRAAGAAAMRKAAGLAAMKVRAIEAIETVRETSGKV